MAMAAEDGWRPEEMERGKRVCGVVEEEERHKMHEGQRGGAVMDGWAIEGPPNAACK